MTRAPSETTIYVCGPMTGVPDFNFPLFFQVERELKAMGYKVENPAKNNGRTLALALADAREERLSWSEYMRLDLVRLAKADAICLLPGWGHSRGASLELYIARQLGMDIYGFRDGRLFSDPAEFYGTVAA